MVLVLLLSLANVNGPTPGTQRVAAGSAPSPDELGERLGAARASRSGAVEQPVAAAPTPPEVEAPPPTPAPHIHPTTTVPHIHPTTTVPHVHPAPAATSTRPRPAPATTRPAPPPTTAPPAPTNREEGAASFFDAAPPGTCAHRSIPFGTVVTVTNRADGRRTTCRVADRGPYVEGRIIDLSREGFAALAPVDSGVVMVAVEW